MLKAVFFDLDGTLLPMDEEKFTKYYFKLLCERMASFGFDPEELVEVIWGGTKEMYKNDGTKTNEERFWDFFVKVYGLEKLNHKNNIDEYYTNEFKKTINACMPNPLAREIVDYCRNNVDKVILSTNPIFPRVGTITRMGFVDLKEDDFDLVTSYENCCYCKPNPNYFLEILKQFNLKPDEVILFGNNSLEDATCAKMAGIKCYLVGDFIINHPKVTESFPIIKMEEVILTIKKEIEERKNA
ncbi:MAG: HAD family hydrolase [Bacilli bacterium]|nr:HAD family hydrolase [Bacilli bacterium]